MNRPKKTRFFDDEERDLIESAEAVFDSDDHRSPEGGELEKMRAEWKAIAEAQTVRKPVTFRLQSGDIDRLKIIAARKGMPYQTLVASVLHQYVNGDLKEL